MALTFKKYSILRSKRTITQYNYKKDTQRETIVSYGPIAKKSLSKDLQKVLDKITNTIQYKSENEQSGFLSRVVLFPEIDDCFNTVQGGKRYHLETVAEGTVYRGESTIAIIPPTGNILKINNKKKMTLCDDILPFVYKTHPKKLNLQTQEFLSHLVSYMLQRPQWNERILFNALALLDYISYETDGEKTLSQYIEEHEEYLYNEVFNNFNFRHNYNREALVMSFYQKFIFLKNVNFGDDEDLDYIESLPLKTWNKLLSTTILSTKNYYHSSIFVHYNYKNFFTRQNFQPTKDIIDFVHTRDIDEYGEKINQEIWKKVSENDTKTPKDLKQVLYDSWTKDNEMKQTYQRFNAIHSYYGNFSEYLRDHSDELSLPQLYAFYYIFVNQHMFWRERKQAYETPSDILDMLNIFKHFDNSFSSFAAFIEELVFENTDPLPSKREWEQGYENFDSSSLEMLPISMVRDMIKIYEGNNSPYIYANIKKVRKYMNENH